METGKKVKFDYKYDPETKMWSAESKDLPGCLLFDPSLPNLEKLVQLALKTRGLSEEAES